MAVFIRLLIITGVLLAHSIPRTNGGFLKAALGLKIGISPEEKGWGQPSLHNGGPKGVKTQFLTGVYGKPPHESHGGHGGHGGGGGGSFFRHLKILGVNLYLGGPSKPHYHGNPHQGQGLSLYKNQGPGSNHYYGKQYGQGQMNQGVQGPIQGGVDYSMNEVGTGGKYGSAFTSNIVGQVFPPMKQINLPQQIVYLPAASQYPSYSNEIQSEMKMLTGQTNLNGPENHLPRPYPPTLQGPIQIQGRMQSYGPSYHPPGQPSQGKRGFSLMSLMTGPQWAPRSKSPFSFFPLSRGYRAHPQMPHPNPHPSPNYSTLSNLNQNQVLLQTQPSSHSLHNVNAIQPNGERSMPYSPSFYGNPNSPPGSPSPPYVSRYIAQSHPNSSPQYHSTQGHSQGQSPPNFGSQSSPNFGSQSSPNFGSQSSPNFGSQSPPNFESQSTLNFGSQGQSPPNFGSQSQSTPNFGSQSQSTLNFGSQGQSTPNFGSQSQSTPNFGSQGQSPPAGFNQNAISFQNSFSNSPAGFSSMNFGPSDGFNGPVGHHNEFNGEGQRPSNAPQASLSYVSDPGGPFASQNQREYSQHSIPQGSQVRAQPEFFSDSTPLGNTHEDQGSHEGQGPQMEETFNRESMPQMPGFAYSHTDSSPVISMGMTTHVDPPRMMEHNPSSSRYLSNPPGNPQGNRNQRKAPSSTSSTKTSQELILEAYKNERRFAAKSSNSNAEAFSHSPTQLQSPIQSQRMNKKSQSNYLTTPLNDLKNNLIKWQPLAYSNSNAVNAANSNAANKLEEQDNAQASTQTIPSSTLSNTSSTEQRSQIIRKRITIKNGGNDDTNNAANNAAASSTTTSKPAPFSTLTKVRS